MADTAASNPVAFERVGSNPTFGTYGQVSNRSKGSGFVESDGGILSVVQIHPCPLFVVICGCKSTVDCLFAIEKVASSSLAIRFTAS